MPYTFSIEDVEYAHVVYSGDFQAGDAKSMWSEIIDHLGSSSQRSILVEEHPSTTGSTELGEVYDTAVLLANAVAFRGVRVAVLIPAPPAKEALRQHRFMVDVAANRGLMVRSFQSKDEAEQWLFSKSVI